MKNFSQIYETFKMKESLRKIIYYGNEAEQEYAFKVLNQLCFDNSSAFSFNCFSNSLR